MIHIFQPESYLRTITEGGRNKPWIVAIDTGSTIENYVAKFFNHTAIRQNNALYRELCGVALAQEFDLSVLNSGLIECNQEFRKNLNTAQQQVLADRYSRHGFGSKYLEGAPTFSPSADFDKLALHEIESIYAFDVLIKNMDRRQGKPNILLKDDTYYLIDHESSLAIPDNKSPFQLITQFPYQRHICHTYLSNKMSHSRKKPDFSTFHELLRQAKFNAVIELAEDMNRLSYEIPDYLVIKRYLDDIRRNRDKFIKTLIDSISYS